MSTSLKYEPPSEPLHICATWLFLLIEGTTRIVLKSLALKMAQAKAKIWPSLSYVCRVRPTAGGQRGGRGRGECEDQIAIFRSLICADARRNPAMRGTYRGNGKRQLDDTDFPVAQGKSGGWGRTACEEGGGM